MPDRPATWDDLVRHEAQKAKVPPKLALALMQQESGGKPDVTSEVGAHGLFQLMPATAQEMGVTDPADPLQNIRGGVGYLRKQLDATKGDVGMALARYHGGPDLAQHGPKTAAYVQSILGRLQAPGAPGAAELATGKPGVTPEPGAEPAGGGRFVSTVLASQLPQTVGQPPPKPPNPQGFEPRPAMTGGMEGSRFDPKVQEWEQQHAEAIGAPPEPGFLERFKQGIDPRTPEGRRNIAGGVGAIAGAALTRTPAGARTGTAVGEAVPAIATRAMAAAPRVLSTIFGAGVGGAAAEGGEQLVGNAPPNPQAILKAGAQQAAYEGIGGGVALLPKMVGRRILTTGVGRRAAESLSRSSTEAAALLESALRSSERPAAAGRQVEAVLAGPAKTARETAGQAVEEAARTGPAVDISRLKGEAERILTAELKPSAVAFPRQPVAGAGEAAAAATGLSPEVSARVMAAGGPSATAMREAIDAAQGEAEKDVLKHPALGVINRILNAEDKVPFAAAHQFKRELDEAIGTAWDRSVQKRVTNITKTLRGTLRESLSGHAPYNAATAKYASIAPLYTQGIASKVRKLAQTSPEAIVRMVKGNDPTKARMLHDVLVKQAAEGGDAAAGQQAWDSVRSAWTAQNMLSGGIDKLGARLSKPDPDFLHVMYGDHTGQQVLTNLNAIHTAYQQAAEQAKRLAQSSVTHVGKQGIEDVSGNILRGVFAWPGIWSGISIGRLLHGPKSAELLEWAAYSPQNTQRLVRAFTSPEPGMVIADILRSTGIADAIAPVREVGTPPPMPPPGNAPLQAGVGAPPPR